MQLLYTTIIIIVTRCKVYNKKKKRTVWKWKDIEKEINNIVCKEGRKEFSGKLSNVNLG